MLCAKLEVWHRESCSNYRTDALNEVSTAFPAGKSSGALGQCDSNRSGRCVTSPSPPCCHSSCNQLPEYFPRGDRKHPLSPLNGCAWCLVSCCDRCTMPDLISALTPAPNAPQPFLTIMRLVKWCDSGEGADSLLNPVNSLSTLKCLFYTQ